jgi:hypothetical protein
MVVMLVTEAFHIKRETYQKADKVKYIVLLATLYLAISHVKLMPFFAIASVCFVYEDFYKLTEKFKPVNWKMIYSAMIFLSLLTFSIKNFSVPAGLNAYPVREVEFVKQNNIKGNILVNFGFGSYVSYKLYPNNLIYIDGRYEEVYDNNLLDLLRNFYTVNNRWYEILEYYPPDVIILEKKYYIYNKMLEATNWTVVYDSKNFAVLLPKTKAHQKYKKPSEDLNYYKKTLFDTNISGAKL